MNCRADGRKDGKNIIWVKAKPAEDMKPVCEKCGGTGQICKSRFEDAVQYYETCDCKKPEKDPTHPAWACDSKGNLRDEFEYINGGYVRIGASIKQEIAKPEAKGIEELKATTPDPLEQAMICKINEFIRWTKAHDKKEGNKDGQ